MKNVIIIGSSGMIGGLLLSGCLERADVVRVTIIVRRPSGLQHPKLVEVLHDNFLDYSDIEGQYLRGQDVCFYCLGVYTGQVPTAMFRTITVDYTRAFAEALKRRSPEAVFCFLSGSGADSSERSRILFAREKGIAENMLLRLGFPGTYLFRPSYIYPVTPRREPNVLYRMMRILYRPLSAVFPGIGVESTQLARKMLSTGLDGGDRSIYEHRDIIA